MKRTTMVIIALFAIQTAVGAATIEWKSETGKWSDEKNWSPQQVPGESDVALFKDKKIKKVIIDKPVNIAKLEVSEEAFVEFRQKADIITKDFLLNGGIWYAKNYTITCSHDFLIRGKAKFHRGGSTVIMSGTGTLHAFLLNKVVMAFKGQTTTLTRSIYPLKLEFKGGTVSAPKAGITFYGTPENFEGWDSTTLNLKGIAFRPSKAAFIKLPSIKIPGSLYLSSVKAKIVYTVEGGKTLDIGGIIGISGLAGGIPTLELDGGTITAQRIYVGNNKDAAAAIRLYSGKLTLKYGLHLKNKNASLVLSEDFVKPRIAENKGSITTE